MTNFFTMNNKFFAAVALLLGVSFASFAGDNNKDGKATSESSVAASAPQTYFVIGRNATNGTYRLSETTSGDCPGGDDPCQITVADPDADVDGNLEIDQTKVDTHNGVTVDETQSL